MLLSCHVMVANDTIEIAFIMKYTSVLFFILFSFFLSNLTSAQQFGTNLEQATETAREEQKQVLLVFTGSDWCKPCILLKREVLGAPEFLDYAKENLVLVNLDFPFRKQNQLSKEVQAYNDEKASRYNPDGKFPRVILLNHEADVIKEFTYKPGMAPATFVEQLQTDS